MTTTFSLRRWLAPLVLLALVAAGCSGGGETACEERIAGVRPGVCLAPPEQRPQATDARFPVLGEDRELGLPDFRGDVVVVNFWGSWCGPCRREQPQLNAAYRELEPLGVSFLGVDLQESSEANGIGHEREFQIPYPSLYDPASSYAARFPGAARTVPSTVLIDRQGRIAATLLGETTDEEVVTLTRMLASE